MARRGENIYKRKDGRYEGRYVVGKTPRGKTRFGYVYGHQYAEVRRKLFTKKAELLAGGDAHYPPGQETIRAWMEHWMESELLGCIKASSWQTYRSQLTRHLLPALGDYKLLQITPKVIQAFVGRLEASGLATATIRSVYRLLSAAMRFALDEGVIPKNPCRKIRLHPSESAEQRVLSRSEQERMRLAANHRGDLPALLGLYSGMRLGEVCALKWSDIDWEKKTITVRRTVQRIARQGAEASSSKTILMVGTPKSFPPGAARSRFHPGRTAGDAVPALRLGLCVRRGGARCRASHHSTPLSAPDGAVGHRGGPFPYPAPQLRYPAFGIGRRHQNGQRPAGPWFRPDHAGLLCPQSIGAAALRHGTAGRLLAKTDKPSREWAARKNPGNSREAVMS